MKMYLPCMLILLCSFWSNAQNKEYKKSFKIPAKDAVQPIKTAKSTVVPSYFLLQPKASYTVSPKATKDTLLEIDLSKLYSDKGCPIEKTFDANGCVNITYSDGTRRIVCDKQYQAVITPDGKVHVQKIFTVYSLTFPLTSPALPNDQAVLAWMNTYNDKLLENLLSYAKPPEQSALKQGIIAKEKTMKLDLYGQIINRVNLLEQFASLR
ncbi:MAG: hypothetical protein U0Y10_13395 [Spirosomataceae bacterium]